MWDLTKLNMWKRNAGYQEQGGGGNGEMLIKGIKLQLCRMSKSQNLTYSIMLAVNITVLNTSIIM